MMKKAINVKVKVGLKSSIIVRNADFCYPRNYRSSQNTFTKVQTQGSTAKKSKPKESRPKDLKLANGKTLAPLHTDKPGKIFCQNKKKKYLKKKQDRKNFTLATGDNVIKDKKKRND